MAYGNFSAPSPALILLSGLPGAGKTTFARALAEVLDFTHVESDAVRRAVAGVPRYTTAESGVVFRHVEAQARSALAAGRHALVDATNLTHKDRKRFLKLATDTGATLVCVRLVAPDALIRARLGSPREGHSQATEAVYDLMRNRPQQFGVPLIVVDTRFPLAPAIALVRALVEPRNGDA
jgi:predicted kinase